MSSSAGALIGRQRELAALAAALASAREGKGGTLLVPGEAGVGKTRLVEAALSNSELTILAGRATANTTPPYGPIVAALREYTRQVPNGLAQCGALSRYLALILPELGVAPAGNDRAALVEAVCHAFECVARRGSTVVFLDDLQWADNATFELLPKLAESLARQPLLVIGAYRSDEAPRGHPMRQLRTELRRLHWRTRSARLPFSTVIWNGLCSSSAFRLICCAMRNPLLNAPRRACAWA